MIHIWGHGTVCRPIARPFFSYFPFGKITRRVSINRWNEQHAQKRGNGEMPLALEELSDAVTASDSISEKIAIQELSASINQFLSTFTSCGARYVCLSILVFNTH